MSRAAENKQIWWKACQDWQAGPCHWSKPWGRGRSRISFTQFGKSDPTKALLFSPFVNNLYENADMQIDPSLRLLLYTGGIQHIPRWNPMQFSRRALGVSPQGGHISPSPTGHRGRWLFLLSSTQVEWKANKIYKKAQMFSAVPSNPIISTDSSKRPLDNDFLYPDRITTDGRQNDRMIIDINDWILQWYVYHLMSQWVREWQGIRPESDKTLSIKSSLVRELYFTCRIKIIHVLWMNNLDRTWPVDFILPDDWPRASGKTTFYQRANVGQPDFSRAVNF